MLALAASAQASIATNPISLAAHKAAIYWGAATDCASVTIKSAGPVTTEASAWTLGLGAEAKCTIYLSNQQWPNWYADDLNFEELCKTMVHEYGHLAGHGDDDGDSVTSITPQFAKVGVCEHYRLKYGGHIFRGGS
jgi:hypothetical protein